MFPFKRKAKSKKKRGLSYYAGPTVDSFHERLRKEQRKKSWLIKVTGLLSLVVVIASLYITRGQGISYTKDNILPVEPFGLYVQACGENNEEICFYRYEGPRTVKIVPVPATPLITSTEPGRTDYRADFLCVFGVGLSMILFPVFMRLYKRI
jgi:hypothetical protein